MWRIKKEWVGKIVIKKITLGRQGNPVEESVGGRPRGQKKCWGNKERVEKAERSISPQAARRQPHSQ